MKKMTAVKNNNNYYSGKTHNINPTMKLLLRYNTHNQFNNNNRQ